MPLQRAKRALLEQEAFRRIYDTNVVGLSLSDLDGHFLFANDETLRIIGYDRSDLESGLINWKALTPIEHLSKDVVAVQEMQATGHCSPFEKEYIRKDGSRIPVLVAFSLVEDNIAFGTIVDLSPERELLAKHATADSTKLGLGVIHACYTVNNYLSAVLNRAQVAITLGREEVKEPLEEIVHFATEALKVNNALVEQAKSSSSTEKTWSKRRRIYKCKTPVGAFVIMPDTADPGHWALSVGGKKLGDYSSPVLAADAVAKKNTGFSDWDRLDLQPAPEDLTGWDPI